MKRLEKFESLCACPITKQAIVNAAVDWARALGVIQSYDIRDISSPEFRAQPRSALAWPCVLPYHLLTLQLTLAVPAIAPLAMLPLPSIAKRLCHLFGVPSHSSKEKPSTVTISHLYTHIGITRERTRELEKHAVRVCVFS